MGKTTAGALLTSALGITGFNNLFRKNKKEQLVSLPVAAIARGSVDMALNTIYSIYRGTHPCLYGCFTTGI